MGSRDAPNIKMMAKSPAAVAAAFSKSCRPVRLGRASVRRYPNRSRWPPERRFRETRQPDGATRWCPARVPPGPLVPLPYAARSLVQQQDEDGDDRAARGDPPAPSPVGASGRKGLSFAPALIGLGVVIGVSIAAELAASLWSTLLLREEAPKLAAVSGLGAAFFSACQAALRFNADAIRVRSQRPSHHRRLVRDRRRRLRPRRRPGGVCGERRRLRPDRRRHRPRRSLRLRAGRAPVGSRTGGRARFRLAVQHADPSARAAGDGGDRANAVAADRVCGLCVCARGDGRRRGRGRLGEPPRAFAAQGLKDGLGKGRRGPAVAGGGPGRRLASRGMALPWRSRCCRASAHGRRSGTPPTHAGNR